MNCPSSLGRCAPGRAWCRSSATTADSTVRLGPSSDRTGRRGRSDRSTSRRSPRSRPRCHRSCATFMKPCGCACPVAGRERLRRCRGRAHGGRAEFGDCLLEPDRIVRPSSALHMLVMPYLYGLSWIELIVASSSLMPAASAVTVPPDGPDRPSPEAARAASRRPVEDPGHDVRAEHGRQCPLVDRDKVGEGRLDGGAAGRLERAESAEPGSRRRERACRWADEAALRRARPEELAERWRAVIARRPLDAWTR
jgi:hypothetical protein